MTITFEWEIGAHYGADSTLYEFGAANCYTWADDPYSSSPVKSGGGALRIYSNTWWYRKPLTASRQKRTGINIWPQALQGGSDTFPLLAVLDASLNVLMVVNVNVSGQLVLIVGGSTKGTYATPLPMQFWRHVGLDFKIDSSAGWAYVYLDGTEILSFSGNTGNADVAWLKMGPQSATNGTFKVVFDDWYCEDTTGEAAAAVVPIKYFIETGPSGNGNYSQWAGSDGNSTDNYQLVDENPPNEDSDFVSATAADLVDTYATTDVAIPVGTAPVAVHPFHISKKLGTAASTIKPVLRENAVDWVGTEDSLTTDYLLYRQRRTLCPDGTAWDQTGLNGMEAGIKSAGAYS